jgi:hypothetical protein
MNPDRVTHLVLEDPLGLADYRTGIPPQSEETLYQHELHWTDPVLQQHFELILPGFVDQVVAGVVE